MDITFKRIVDFLGRNGMFKAAGISITNSASLVTLEPITNRGGVGRAMIEIPHEDLWQVVGALKELLPECAFCERPIEEEPRSSCIGSSHLNCFIEHQPTCNECEDDTP